MAVDNDRDRTELKQMQEELMHEIRKKPQFVGSIPECIGGIRPEHVKDKDIMNAIMKEVTNHTISNGHQKREDRMDIEIVEPKPPKRQPQEDKEAKKRQKLVSVAEYDEQLWNDVAPEFIFKQYLIYHTMCVIQPDYEARVEAAKDTDAGKRTKRIISAIKCLASTVGARTGSQIDKNAFQIMQRTIQLVAFPKIDKLAEIMECSVSGAKTKKGQAYTLTFRVKSFDDNNQRPCVEEFQRVMNEEWMSYFVNWSLLNLRDITFRAIIEKQLKIERANTPNIPDPSLASAVVRPEFAAECMKLFKKPLCYFFSRHCTQLQKVELLEHFGEQWFS